MKDLPVKLGVDGLYLLMELFFFGVAERNPNSDVLGIDLHCLSPSRVVPDNCSFDIASAQGYWDFLEGQKVDFIFQRFLGWIPDFEGIFTSMYDNLEPGGWVELHEWVLNFQSANGSMDGTALGRWNMLMQKGTLRKKTPKKPT